MKKRNGPLTCRCSSSSFWPLVASPLAHSVQGTGWFSVCVCVCVYLCLGVELTSSSSLKTEDSGFLAGSVGTGSLGF